jgi:hypothetical protein
MLFRYVRRRTAWESGDPDQLLSVEFRNNSGITDLNPSVYQIEDAQVIQTHAEHTAGIADSGRAKINPRSRPWIHVDLIALLARAHEVAGDGPFAFTSGAHREVRFASEQELRQALADLIGAGIPVSDIAAEDVRQYVRGRLIAQDQEWVAFCERHPNWAEWTQPNGPPAAPAAAPPA